MKRIVPVCCLLSALSILAQSQRYKVIAYYTGNGETIRQYPVEKLTHIIFSFLKMKNDTLTFHNDRSWSIKLMQVPPATT